MNPELEMRGLQRACEAYRQQLAEARQRARLLEEALTVAVGFIWVSPDTAATDLLDLIDENASARQQEALELLEPIHAPA